MNIVSSRLGLRLPLLVVIVAGAVAVTVAPEEGAVAIIFMAIGAALFGAEIGLGIAEHLRSLRDTDGG